MKQNAEAFPASLSLKLSLMKFLTFGSPNQVPFQFILLKLFILLQPASPKKDGLSSWEPWVLQL